MTQSYNDPKVCAILPVIRSHIQYLMPLLKNELNGEYALNNATKCLYTAVAVMTIYLGKSSLQQVAKCDVDYVNSFYAQMKKSARARNPASEFDPSPLFIKHCAQSLLTSSKTTRYLYYVMITNAYVTNPLTNKKVLFPGHVFVIEKYPNGKYAIYQSYINEYDLNGHYDRNASSFSISHKALTQFFSALHNLYSVGTWTPEMSEQWEKFTHVPGAKFEGHVFKGASFFCYRKVPIKSCVGKLSKMINGAVKQNTLSESVIKGLRHLNERLSTVV